MIQFIEYKIEDILDSFDKPYYMIKPEDVENKFGRYGRELFEDYLIENLLGTG
ncbi:MAG: hypothetical protein ABIF08_04830 [Nanoarchaeota archaeon]